MSFSVKIKNKIMGKKVKTKKDFQLAVIREHTAAVDIGSMLMVVAYTDQDGQQQLMQADGFTDSLDEMLLFGSIILE
jgi:hypothetical protein